MMLGEAATPMATVVSPSMQLIEIVEFHGRTCSCYAPIRGDGVMTAYVLIAIISGIVGDSIEAAACRNPRREIA